MRPVLRVVVGALACIAHLAKAKPLSRELPQDSSQKTGSGVSLQEVREGMNQTVFRKVSLNKVRLIDAIHFIQAPDDLASKYKYGFGFIIRSTERAEGKSVSLDGEMLFFAEILNAICEQTGFWWRVEPYAILVTPDKPALPNAGLKERERLLSP